MESFVAYPSYPACRANFSYIFLQNLANSLHEKQKVSSASRVTHLNRASPFFNERVPVTIGIRASSFSKGRVTLQTGQTFLHINTLVQLGQGETIRAGASAVVRSWLWQRGPYKRSLKMTRLEETLFNWTTFLHITARPNWWGWPCFPKWLRVKRKVTSFRGKLKESGIFCSRKLIFDISSTDTEPDEKPREVIVNSLMLNQFSPRTLVS